jgi:hypothetical protein
VHNRDTRARTGCTDEFAAALARLLLLLLLLLLLRLSVCGFEMAATLLQPKQRPRVETKLRIIAETGALNCLRKVGGSNS